MGVLDWRLNWTNAGWRAGSVVRRNLKSISELCQFNITVCTNLTALSRSTFSGGSCQLSGGQFPPQGGIISMRSLLDVGPTLAVRIRLRFTPCRITQQPRKYVFSHSDCAESKHSPQSEAICSLSSVRHFRGQVFADEIPLFFIDGAGLATRVSMKQCEESLSSTSHSSGGCIQVEFCVETLMSYSFYFLLSDL